MTMMQITRTVSTIDLDSTEKTIHNAFDRACWAIHKRLNGTLAPYMVVEHVVCETCRMSNFPEMLEAVLTPAAVLQRFENDYPGEWSAACAVWKSSRVQN